MAEQSIPVVDLREYEAGGERRDRFCHTVGEALERYGFFAVEHHHVGGELIDRAYRAAQAFYALPAPVKARYHREGAAGQRGFTRFGQEHARDSDRPDLKEFYQLGRVGVPDDHPVHRPYGPNLWPAEVADFEPAMSELYRRLDALGATLLHACAHYLGEPERLFSDMAEQSDTIVRIIHYPPIPEDAPADAVRAAAHEDINLITLLCGATADGLELLARDGAWLPIAAAHEQIIVDSGDMLQNLTNGLFRSMTHRVVNPDDGRQSRYSMPCFVHPRKEVDLSPLPGCVARTGGTERYPRLTAGEYLAQRLREIGLTV
jgi:isopenicillin N synthase-like dioxygenase